MGGPFDHFDPDDPDLVLCSPQQKLDLNGLKWKDNAAVLSTVEHASVEQCGHITVNGLHISTDAAGGFTD